MAERKCCPFSFAAELLFVRELPVHEASAFLASPGMGRVAPAACIPSREGGRRRGTADESCTSSLQHSQEKESFSTPRGQVDEGAPERTQSTKKPEEDEARAIGARQKDEVERKSSCTRRERESYVEGNSRGRDGDLQTQLRLLENQLAYFVVSLVTLTLTFSSSPGPINTGPHAACVSLSTKSRVLAAHRQCAVSEQN